MYWANEWVVQNEIVRKEKKRNNDLIVSGIELIREGACVSIVSKLVCLDLASNYYLVLFSCLKIRTKYIT